MHPLFRKTGADSADSRGGAQPCWAGWFNAQVVLAAVPSPSQHHTSGGFRVVQMGTFECQPLSCCRSRGPDPLGAKQGLTHTRDPSLPLPLAAPRSTRQDAAPNGALKGFHRLLVLLL